MSLKNENPFILNKNAKYTACVGINGGTDDKMIRKGYKQAVSLLMRESMKMIDIDLYVYPLIYCAGHSIELGLKIIIRDIIKIYNIKNIMNSDIEETYRKINTHNILQLHNNIKKIGTIDSRILKKYNGVEGYLKDYFKDPEGDAFKYESSSAGIAHMQSKSIQHINLGILIKRFEVMNKYLDSTYHHLEELKIEYECQTFTKSLSRNNIHDIAKQLPKHSEWTLESFKDMKNSIKEEYKIGTKELSDAINIIKSHYEFCNLIGLEEKYGNLSNHVILEYKNLVTKIQEFDESSMSRNKSYNNTFNIINKRSELSKKVTNTWDMHTINVILALLDVGKFSYYYCEDLDKLYKYMNDSKYDRSWAIEKIGRPKSMEYVQNGMKKCGQITYLKLLNS